MDNNQLTREDIEIAKGSELGDEIFESIFEDYPVDETDEDDNGMLQSSIVFSLFVNCIHYLTYCGWTNEDLFNEVIEHSECCSENQQQQ